MSPDGEPVLDEAEVTLLIKLREVKDQYRQNYEELLSTKAEVQYCRHLVDQCRVRLFTGNLLMIYGLAISTSQLSMKAKRESNYLGVKH